MTSALNAVLRFHSECHPSTKAPTSSLRKVGRLAKGSSISRPTTQRTFDTFDPQSPHKKKKKNSSGKNLAQSTHHSFFHTPRAAILATDHITARGPASNEVRNSPRPWLVRRPKFSSRCRSRYLSSLPRPQPPSGVWAAQHRSAKSKTLEECVGGGKG